MRMLELTNFWNAFENAWNLFLKPPSTENELSTEGMRLLICIS